MVVDQRLLGEAEPESEEGGSERLGLDREGEVVWLARAQGLGEPIAQPPLPSRVALSQSRIAPLQPTQPSAAVILPRRIRCGDQPGNSIQGEWVSDGKEASYLFSADRYRNPDARTFG
jgi:hypothetical protein